MGWLLRYRQCCGGCAVPIEVVAEVSDASCLALRMGKRNFLRLEAREFQFSDDSFNFGSTSVFGGISSGSYAFFVQDENGCVESVEVTIGEPDAIVVTAIVSEGRLDGEGALTSRLPRHTALRL